MTRDDFEFLVSQWLDEPARADLTGAIDAAVAATPEFAAIRDSWLGFDRAARSLAGRLPRVDWRRQAGRITESAGRAATDAGDAASSEHADARLDALLTALPQPPIDWEKLRGRITQNAVSRRQGRSAARIGWIAAFTAAAALIGAVALRPWIYTNSSQAAPMVAAAVVRAAGAQADRASAMVRVTVGRASAAPPTSAGAAGESEFYLMIDPAPAQLEQPPQVSARTDDGATRLALLDSSCEAMVSRGGSRD